MNQNQTKMNRRSFCAVAGERLGLLQLEVLAQHALGGLAVGLGVVRRFEQRVREVLGGGVVRAGHSLKAQRRLPGKRWKDRCATSRHSHVIQKPVSWRTDQAGT